MHSQNYCFENRQRLSKEIPNVTSATANGRKIDSPTMPLAELVRYFQYQDSRHLPLSPITYPLQCLLMKVLGFFSAKVILNQTSSAQEKKVTTQAY